MITSQAKRLKRDLKIVGVKASVKTEVRRFTVDGVRGREYGDAVAIVNSMTDDQALHLRFINQYVKIKSYPQHGFTSVRY